MGEASLKTPLVAAKPLRCVAREVRAILDNEKTETRRVIKPQPVRRADAWYWGHARYDNGFGVKYFHSEVVEPSLRLAMARCAPYAVGDLVYVRETYTLDASGQVVYLADYRLPEDVIRGREAHQRRWRPSIHMPRDLARLYLRIIDVRGEQLQEISQRDVLAEGCSLRSEFAVLWDDIGVGLGDRSAWAANPWVWVYDFKRVPA